MQGRRLTLSLIPQIDPTYTTNDPNPYQLVDDTVEIRLINGTRPAVIDLESLALCGRYHWYAEWQPELQDNYAVADVRLKNGDWATITMHDLIMGTAMAAGRVVNGRIVPRAGAQAPMTQQPEDSEVRASGEHDERDEDDAREGDEDEAEELRLERAIYEKAQLQDDAEWVVFGIVSDAPYEDWYPIDQVLLELPMWRNSVPRLPDREEVERILQRFEARGILQIAHVTDESGEEEAIYFTNAAYRSTAGFSHVPVEEKMALARNGDERAQKYLTDWGISWTQANVAPPRPKRTETTPRRSPRPLTSWGDSEAVSQDE